MNCLGILMLWTAILTFWLKMNRDTRQHGNGWMNEKARKQIVADITEEDRLAFSAFFFETYMQKVTSVLRRIDPNHMYLGCRFNQDKNQELTNPAIFKVAGKYMDIISINHYASGSRNRSG